MIFYRSQLREFFLTASAVCAVLLAIMVTTQFIRLLGMAAGGKFAADGVAAILGFTAFNYLPIVLSLTLFITVLSCLSRMHRDSEMVVWSASGVSPTAWIGPVLAFALPLSLVIGALSLGLSPWANQKSDEFRRQLESRDESASVSAGVFRESRGGDRVYFVESVSREDNTVGNVFVHSVQNQKVGSMVARRGFLETRENGDRFLVLEQGRRYEGEPGSAEFRTTVFERYAVRIETAESRSGNRPVKGIPTLELLANPIPAHIAEFTWRCGLPIMAVILALAAIPLSHVNPRVGRSLNYVFAIMLYMLYSNLLSIVQAWIAQGRLAPAIGFWVVHAVMLAVALAMFSRHAFALSWPRLRWPGGGRSSSGPSG
ncbi:MAG: LPS export ABC transporter permease LptF [Burkholderiales bacterium]|nr:LPS export ABC transporter permease LptF [Burkholderiales bacterium]